MELEKFSRSLRLQWLWYSWEDRSRPWKGVDLPIDRDDLALFNAATMVTVGNGNKASFWTSHWLQGDAPAQLYPALFRHSKRKNQTVKDALTDDKWIQDVDYNMSQTIIVEFMGLWLRLQVVELMPLQEDKINWLHSSDGQYSAKSAYQLQFCGMSSSLTAESTWKAKTPPKCHFFVWLMLQNRLWTAARLQIRGFCTLYIRNLETASHLFQECHYSRQVWNKVASWIMVVTMSPTSWSQIGDLGQWFVAMGNFSQNDKKEGVRSMIVLTVWEIWKERNNRIFRKTSKTPDQLSNEIREEAKLWIRAGNKGIELLLPSSTQLVDVVPAGPNPL